jgi:predicted ArsR family transcriptional regulator
MPQGEVTVVDEEIINAMRERDGPAFTTAEIASWFDMTTEGIRRRLNELAEEGAVEYKKPTTRTVLWWLPKKNGYPRSSACCS